MKTSMVLCLAMLLPLGAVASIIDQTEIEISAVHAGHRAEHMTLLKKKQGAGDDETGSRRAVPVDASGVMEPTSSFIDESQRSFLWVTPAQMRMLTKNKQPALTSLMQGGVQASSGPFATEATALRNLYDTEYVGPIGVGTLPCDDVSLAEQEGGTCRAKQQAELSVVFDTGSTNLWMASDLCTRSPCHEKGRKYYDHKKSSTYKSPLFKMDIDVEFGTGELKGEQGIDDFHIGPFTVKHQTFGLISEELGHTFRDLPLEGIVGLGFPSMAASNEVPFFDSVIEQKVLKKNEFAFYFNVDPNGGNAILWGGVDPSLYEGEIRMFPVTQAHYWALDLHEFRIGKKVHTVTGAHEKQSWYDWASSLGSMAMSVIPSHHDEEGNLMDTSANSSLAKVFKAKRRIPKLIVDSGTTYFTADGPLYDTIRETVPDARCDETKNYPDLIFKLKDVAGKFFHLKVKPHEYMVSDDGINCVGAFLRIAVPSEYGPAMLLGEVFMRNYFTVFDRGDGSDTDARVGFARAKQGHDIDAKLVELPGQSSSFYQKMRSTSSKRSKSMEQRSVTLDSQGRANHLVRRRPRETSE